MIHHENAGSKLLKTLQLLSHVTSEMIYARRAYKIPHAKTPPNKAQAAYMAKTEKELRLNSSSRTVEFCMRRLKFHCRHQLSNGALQASKELCSVTSTLSCMCPVPSSDIQKRPHSSFNFHQCETNCTVKDDQNTV